MKTFYRFMALICLLTLTSCGSDSASEPDGSSLFKLAITDAPVTDAARVVIAFEQVELKHSDTTYTFDLAADGNDYQSIDLLQLQGAVSEQIVNEEVESGQYEWIRLHINTEEGASFIELDDGSIHDITIPSGAQTGLKLVQGFTMPAFGSVDFTLDFDLAKSLVMTGNGEYKLKPTIRIIDNLESGHIEGTINASVMEQAGCSEVGVYVFDGHDASFDDLGSDAEALTTVEASYNDVDSIYEFEIGFVPFGDYSLHLLCNPVDDPELDEELDSFTDMNVSVTESGVTSVTFD